MADPADDRDDAPSGLPDEGDQLEPPPLGSPETASEDEANGAEAMPGIPTDGEPPVSG